MSGHPHHHRRRPHPHQHSYPVLVARRGQTRTPGRQLPPTPNKPSTLQLKPANINFPKLNASPTHGPHMGGSYAPVQRDVLQHPPTQHMQRFCPMSYEQAFAMGRGGISRMLPSPVLNGYKLPPQGR